MTLEPATYPGYRFPVEIINHAVWLYHVFGLSLREVELILAERGITVSHESIRQWCLKFGAIVTQVYSLIGGSDGRVWLRARLHQQMHGCGLAADAGAEPRRPWHRKRR